MGALHSLSFRQRRARQQLCSRQRPASITAPPRQQRPDGRRWRMDERGGSTPPREEEEGERDGRGADVPAPGLQGTCWRKRFVAAIHPTRRFASHRSPYGLSLVIAAVPSALFDWLHRRAKRGLATKRAEVGALKKRHGLGAPAAAERHFEIGKRFEAAAPVCTSVTSDTETPPQRPADGAVL